MLRDEKLACNEVSCFVDFINIPQLAKLTLAVSSEKTAMFNSVIHSLRDDVVIVLVRASSVITKQCVKLFE